MKAGKGKAIALGIAGLGAAGIITAVFGFREAIIDWWHRIPVTRTWGDLLAQDPIDLGGGVKVRLGIEATRCPRWSGVLIYCLTEGYDPSGPIYDDDLGPFRVTLIVGGVKTKEISETSRGFQSFSHSPGQWLLFTRTIPISRAGRYEVQASSNDGKVLRKALIQGTTEPFHPWMPLENLHREGTGYLSAILKNRPDGFAFPNRKGFEVIDSLGKEKAALRLEMPLPTLLPAATRPEILLEMEENHLVLNSDQEMSLDRPEIRFLARWWVNDEPYYPAVPPSRSKRFRSSGQMFREKNLRLRMQFDPVSFGARKGDRIGLQLLHVPMGWEFFGPDRAPLHFAMNNCPLLTNRIEFTVP